MKFVGITAPKDDIDFVIEEYIENYDMQIENALLELKSNTKLLPYTENNPYKDIFTIANNIKDFFNISSLKLDKNKLHELDIEIASSNIKTIKQKLDYFLNIHEKINEKQKLYEERLADIKKFIGLSYDVSKILKFKHIRFRFGRIPKDYYTKFIDFVYDDIDSIFYQASEDANYIWALYFVPEKIHEKIDAIYQSMHFERFYLSADHYGTPEEEIKALEYKLMHSKLGHENVNKKIATLCEKYKETFFISFEKLKSYNNNFGIRKLSAITDNSHKPFFIICGWMKEKDANSLYNKISENKKTFAMIEEDHSTLSSSPPTSLKNPCLFRPFEMFVDMYGLPNYKEFDPTILVAILYSVFFGFMFGDVGQGLILFLIGYLLAHLKKSKLAGIISRCGLFSIIFGFLFGSIFGFENIIPALLLHPKTAITKLPIIGNLNSVFIISIILGMFVILLSMIFNIINRFKMKELGEALFDTNGIAGFVFYASSIITIILIMLRKTLPATYIIFIMFIVPLVIIFFKEPLTHIIEKKAHILPDDKSMFFIQGFFEIIEILLSYFSNTLSFVRIGAFAVSHAAMMEVVLMLAGVESGNPNIFIIILGNIFVICMEGLIVGIQVLRLQYYELFSRFYTGGGRAFIPYGSKN